MKMSTKNFLKKYDEFTKKKYNSNELDTSILNIAKAVKKPSHISIDEKTKNLILNHTIT